VTDHDIRNALLGALECLLEEDGHLFKAGTSERSLTFRLGVNLQNEVDDHWRVDSEYNRNENVPKRLEQIKGKRLALNPKSRSRGDVYPDLIVHHRGKEGPNRLAIETKKADEQTAKNTAFDYMKLREYQTELGYGSVAFVVFGTDEAEPYVKVFFDVETSEFVRVPNRS
jgi:hypothetical protein